MCFSRDVFTVSCDGVGRLNRGSQRHGHERRHPKLDFGRLRSIAGCADQGVEGGLRNLDDLSLWRGYTEIVIGPELAPDKGERVAEGREWFGIPRRRTRRRHGLAVEMLGPKRDQGEQAEQ